MPMMGRSGFLLCDFEPQLDFDIVESLDANAVAHWKSSANMWKKPVHPRRWIPVGLDDQGSFIVGVEDDELCTLRDDHYRWVEDALRVAFPLLRRTR